MVETAITMPLFVFIILGSIQMSLIHQARLLAKYAAYKAVRAGSLYHAKVSTMESAALRVVLPMVTYQKSGQDLFMKTRNAAQYGVALAVVGPTNLYPTMGQKIAEVTICGPTRAAASGGNGGHITTGPGGNGNGISGTEVSFDDPTVAADMTDWSSFEKTKLRIQLTFYYRMPIPFANMMLYHIYRGDQTKTMGLITRTAYTAGTARAHTDGQDGKRDAFAMTKQYIIPIRTSYAMRMQSALFPDKHKLPDQNECILMEQK